MKIYLINKGTDICNYDENVGHVIVADNKNKALEIAQSAACDEQQSAWCLKNIVLLGRYTGKKKKPFIVLTKFNAG